MEVVANRWQSRIEKRRNEGRDVLGYVDQIMRDNRVPLEDVASFITFDELQELTNRIVQRAEKEAEEKAAAEAYRLEEERQAEENYRAFEAFWKTNPLSPLTAVDIQTESDLFDVLAHYYIVKVEYSFDTVNYHWEDFENIEDPSIQACLPPDIYFDLVTELPHDEQGIGEAINEAILHFGFDRAVRATSAGRLQEGKVIFDVPARRINLEATIAVTREESLELTWAPDQDSD